MEDWQEWSDGWLREGYFISYLRDNVRFYEHVIRRDLAHYVLTWHEPIGAEATSGPTIPTNLVMTLGYDERTNQNHKAYSAKKRMS